MPIANIDAMSNLFIKRSILFLFIMNRSIRIILNKISISNNPIYIGIVQRVNIRRLASGSIDELHEDTSNKDGAMIHKDATNDIAAGKNASTLQPSNISLFFSIITLINKLKLITSN